MADVGLPPMYGGPATKPKTLGLDRCAAFRSAQGPRGRPAVAGIFNSGTNFLMKLLRMNCDFTVACPAQPHIIVDKDNPYEAEIRIMAEMQLARRNNCSPFCCRCRGGSTIPWTGAASTRRRAWRASTSMVSCPSSWSGPVHVDAEHVPRAPAFFQCPRRSSARRHGVRREV